MWAKKYAFGLWVYYIIVLIWIVLFKLQFSLADLPHFRNINLIPFAESAVTNGTVDFSEIIGNVMLFIPYGLFLHILLEKKSLFRQFLPIFCTCMLFEIFQFVFAIGGSDITDVFTNSLGGICGIFLAVCLKKGIGKHWICFINVLGSVGAVLFTGFFVLIAFAN